MGRGSYVWKCGVNVQISVNAGLSLMSNNFASKVAENGVATTGEREADVAV